MKIIGVVSEIRAIVRTDIREHHTFRHKMVEHDHFRRIIVIQHNLSFRIIFEDVATPCLSAFLLQHLFSK